METDPALSRAVRRSILSAPLELIPLEADDTSECRRFRVASPSHPAAVVAAWNEATNTREGGRPWLLEPLTGDALRAERKALLVCTPRPTPDWPERAAHPDLWPLRDDAEFLWNEERSAVLRSRSPSAGETRVGRIEFVQVLDRQAPWRVAAGEIDVGVVYGRTADMLLGAGELPVELERIPAWDKSYALWLNTSVRWLNDPRFRRWISATIDRQAAVDYLFAGRGEPAGRLLAGGEDRAPPPLGPLPFANSSEPHLTLTFDREDLHIAGVAARVKAALEQNSVTVEIFGRTRSELRTGMEDGRFHMAVVAHHPPLADPALGLQDTLAPLGSAAADVWRRLDRISRIGSAELRAERTLLIEDSLVEEARLIPLMRIHAWLVRAGDLQRVDVGRYGVLRFDRAEWRR